MVLIVRRHLVLRKHFMLGLDCMYARKLLNKRMVTA